MDSTLITDASPATTSMVVSLASTSSSMSFANTVALLPVKFGNVTSLKKIPEEVLISLLVLNAPLPATRHCILKGVLSSSSLSE